MTSDIKKIKRKINKVTTFLEQDCGCNVEYRNNKYHVVSFTPPDGKTGTITLSATPRSFELWEKDLKTTLRKEMIQVGFSESRTKDMKNAMRLITMVDDKDVSSKFDNLLNYCFNKTMLPHHMINDLCNDRMLGKTYDYLSVKYDVSKSTIYRYLKANGLIRYWDD